MHTHEDRVNQSYEDRINECFTVLQTREAEVDLFPSVPSLLAAAAIALQIEQIFCATKASAYIPDRAYDGISETLQNAWGDALDMVGDWEFVEPEADPVAEAALGHIDWTIELPLCEAEKRLGLRSDD